MTVELQGVRLSHGRSSVLRELNLSLRAGCIAALYGANGAGKSSLLRLIAGLNGAAKVTGQGQVLGHPFWSRTAGARSQIAYMPQHGGLYEELTVLDNLRFRVAMLGKTDSLAHSLESIRAQGLQQVQNQTVATLSGGWKQRVAFAVALLASPRLLLLDEPTAGVDLEAKAQIWKQIRGLSIQGVSIVLSTHDPEEAKHAQELICLQSGRIAYHGASQELSRSLGLHIIRIESASNELDERAGLEEEFKRVTHQTSLKHLFSEHDEKGMTLAFRGTLETSTLSELISEECQHYQNLTPTFEQSLRAALLMQDDWQ